MYTREHCSDNMPCMSLLSSIMSVWTFIHRSNAVTEPSEAGTCDCRSLSFALLWLAMSLQATARGSSFPSPIPDQECSVHPSMFTEAMPVEAVTASPRSGRSCLYGSGGSGLYLSRKWAMIARKRTDFPAPLGPSACHNAPVFAACCVPAEPVKKTFLPDCTSFKMALCSADKALSRANVVRLGTSGSGGGGAGVKGTRSEASVRSRDSIASSVIPTSPTSSHIASSSSINQSCPERGSIRSAVSSAQVKL